MRDYRQAFEAGLGDEHPIERIGVMRRQAHNFGRVVEAEGYGVVSLELRVPATAETVYEIGSITMAENP